jgi:hypothetical protein
MALDRSIFDRSVRRQIAIHRARTPTERFQALCDLLDAARALAPNTPEARRRRTLALAHRQREREKLREHFRRLIAQQRSDAQQGV